MESRVGARGGIHVIVGIGVDLVEVSRFRSLADKTPSFVDKFLADDEKVDSSGERLLPESLAARVAAKEAVMKALEDTRGVGFLECQVVTLPSGKPTLTLSGYLSELAHELGVTDWHVSLSHDGGFAMAFVVAESN